MYSLRYCRRRKIIEKYLCVCTVYTHFENLVIRRSNIVIRQSLKLVPDYFRAKKQAIDRRKPALIEHSEPLYELDMESM
jgi:hypothetical protein